MTGSSIRSARALDTEVRPRAPSGRPAGADERRVHGGRGEDRLEDHHRRSDDPGLIAELAGTIRSRPVARGDPRHHLADAGQQRLAGTGHVAADDDDRRVEHVDAGGQHAADGVAGLPRERTASGCPASTWATTSRLVRVPRPSSASRTAIAAPPATASRQPIAAPAHDVVVVGHVDVADVAGAPSAPVHVATGHEPRSDARADLDEQEERLVAPGRPVLADGHDVHVVVDEGGHTEALGEALADRAGSSRA